MTKGAQNVEKQRMRRDIIKDYTSFDSQVYAPMTRIGVYLDAGSEQYTVKNQYNSTLNGTIKIFLYYHCHIHRIT